MSYRVGTVLLELYFPHVRSLKEKRSILRSLIAKVRQAFNVSVAEVEHQDLWQRATIAVAVVSANLEETHKSLDAVLSFVEVNLSLGLVINSQRELF